MADVLINIGARPNADWKTRDAIHVAVYAAYNPLSKVLNPGQKVYIDERGYIYAANDGEEWDGIVDPFLSKGVINNYVWVILKPGTVKNLRHNWDHDKLPVSEATNYDNYYDECRGCD